MGLVRLVRAGTMQYLASALRQVPISSSDRLSSRFADSAVSNSAWPASRAHVTAAKQLDACLEDLHVRSSHGDMLGSICT